MQSQTILKGDQLVDNGAVVYTVDRVLTAAEMRDLALVGAEPGVSYTVVTVRYEVDGGTGLRAWPFGTQVPLTRPTDEKFELLYDLANDVTANHDRARVALARLITKDDFRTTALERGWLT